MIALFLKIRILSATLLLAAAALFAPGCGGSSSSPAAADLWTVDKTSISMTYTSEFRCPALIDTITITNAGNSALLWSISGDAPPWLDFSGLSGVLDKGASAQVPFMFSCIYYVHGQQETSLYLTAKNADTGKEAGTQKINVQVIVEKWRW
jgi:hypothetical protein